MVTEETKEPVHLTIECLRGHSRNIVSSDEFDNPDVRDYIEQSKCPQCGAGPKSVTDGTHHYLLDKVSEQTVSKRRTAKK